MEQEQKIPEEIRNWLKPLEAHFGLRYGQGAEAMYHYLAPELAALTEERDAYRKALAAIAADGWHNDPSEELCRIRTIAKFIIDKYPSPSPYKSKDNGE